MNEQNMSVQIKKVTTMTEGLKMYRMKILSNNYMKYRRKKIRKNLFLKSFL